VHRVHELIHVDATTCESADADGDGTVGIDELLDGVRYAIDGCEEAEGSGG